MRKIKFPLLLFIFTSCNQTLSIDGFDKKEWRAFSFECSEYRLSISDLLIDNKEVLLESNQNEIESLLGPASEHELYERNQKFFHYRLTPADSCGQYENKMFLSIRFNAIGRANDIQAVIRE